MAATMEREGFSYGCGSCGRQFSEFAAALACTCEAAPAPAQAQASAATVLTPATVPAPALAPVAAPVQAPALVPALAPSKPRRDVLTWTDDQTRLLITACSDSVVQPNNPSRSKQDMRGRWIKVQGSLEAHGYRVSWEDCRKKWYRLLQKYKDVKECKNRSGEGAASWSFYDDMDTILAKDPAIQPHHVIATTPASKEPIKVTNSAVSGQTFPGPEDTDLGQPFAGSPGTPSGTPARKRRRQSATSASSTALKDMTNLMEQEMENRQHYRQQKLMLLEKLANALAGNSQ